MTMSITTSAIVLGCIVAVYIGRRHLRNTQPTFPLPPGPPGLPWIGNVVGVNPSAPWVTYRDWGKTYGR